MMAIVGIAILVGGFSAGRLIGQLAAVPPEPQASPSASLEPIELPEVDRPGRDIARLPRYPGSVRIEYDRRVRAAAVVIRVAYAARAARSDVRSFYADVFRENGWEIVDLDFSGNTWSFDVEQGRLRATVELSSDDAVVRVRMELVRSAPQAPDPTPQEPEQPPQPATPPPDDDDDEGDDDDDDDDDDDGSDDGGDD
jgi:hypothetical protein